MRDRYIGPGMRSGGTSVIRCGRRDSDGKTHRSPPYPLPTDVVPDRARALRAAVDPMDEVWIEIMDDTEPSKVGAILYYADHTNLGIYATPDTRGPWSDETDRVLVRLAVHQDDLLKLLGERKTGDAVNLCGVVWRDLQGLDDDRVVGCKTTKGDRDDR